MFEEHKLCTVTIEGYWTVIAGALNFSCGYDFGKDPQITALIHSFRQERSKQSKVIPDWDLGLVLLVLTRAPFEPLSTANFKYVTWKAAFLTLLASGGRRGEVHALSCKKLVFDPNWNWVSLEVHPGLVAKTQIIYKGSSVLQLFGFRRSDSDSFGGFWRLTGCYAQYDA